MRGPVGPVGVRREGISSPCRYGKERERERGRGRKRQRERERERERNL